MKKGKWYVGIKRNELYQRERFSSEVEPTASTHGDKYLYVIGPFKTRGGAEAMRKWGAFNPHVQTVEDAELIARKYSL